MSAAEKAAHQRPDSPGRLFIIFPAVAVALIMAGVGVTFWIGQNVTIEQLARNVLLAATPFILTFVAIILLFITFIMAISYFASGRLDARTHFRIELFIIICIVAGIVGIFQQWVKAFYSNGFLLLLFSTLAFIVWSHIAPRRVRLQEE
jgi:ABC-type transport system involved in cytochrome c biogenesis permease subunit